MHDPYTPPDALGPALPGAMGGSTRGMQWRRVLLGSVVLFLALAAWSFMAGLLIPTVGFWLAPDGAWIDTAIVVRKVVYMMVSTFAYWWFAKGVGHRRLLHVLLAWSLVQVIDTVVVMIVLPSSPTRFAWTALALGLLPALAGCALTWIWPGRRPRIPHGDR